MKIGFIGAGKVGFSLGKFFSHNGITVTGYYSRHRESAQEAAEFTGSMCYDALGALIQDSDALFLTVTDAAIPSVFQQLKEFELSGKQICHCSGAMSAQEAFSGIAQTGAYGYSIHPLFPISSKLESYRELSGAFFCMAAMKRISAIGRRCYHRADRRCGLSPVLPRCAIMPHVRLPAI